MSEYECAFLCAVLDMRGRVWQRRGTQDARAVKGARQGTYPQHSMQFGPCSVDSLRVRRVHHENDGVSVGVVAAPVGADGGLATQIPHLQQVHTQHTHT